MDFGSDTIPGGIGDSLDGALHMKIIIHLGLHKTGTTSLQRGLWSRCSISGEGKIWYPSHEGEWSHNVLVNQIRERLDRNILSDWRAEAENRKSSALVISSEDFSNMSPTLFAKAFSASDDDITLVFTLSPFVRRIFSLWQESVKHGSPLSLDESLAWLLDTASLSPVLIERFARACPFAKIAVVVADNKAPDILWENFEDAVGALRGTLRTEQLHLNRSLDHMSAEMLRVVNIQWQRANRPPAERWVLVQRLAELSQQAEWNQAAGENDYTLPKMWQKPMRTLAASTLHSIRRLRDKQRVQVFGDLSRLIDFQPLQN